MRWLLRMLRLHPRPNGHAAEAARRDAEAKLRATAVQARYARAEADRFAAMIEQALRGRAI